MTIDVITLKEGMVIRGKWHKKRYRIMKQLGAGTVGTVYLCQSADRLVAMKLSTQTLSLMREVNILKQIQKVQATSLVPFLYDVDDYIKQDGTQYAFYCMEYIHGQSLQSFIRSKGNHFINEVLLQMLTQLEALHQVGYIYGDLKNDNILIDVHTNDVRLLDVGGITKHGYALKEYSALYDRATWQAGSRKAEASYDLFALVITILLIYYPKQKLQTECRTISDIMDTITRLPALRPYVPIFKKALENHYTSALEMKVAIQYMIQQGQRGKRIARRQKSKRKRDIAILTSFSFFYMFIRYLVSYF